MGELDAPLLEPAGFVEQGPGLVVQGDALNGLQLNGLNFNGLKFNGLTFNGISFDGLRLNGGSLDGQGVTGSLELRGGELVSFTDRGMLGGEDLEDAKLHAVFSNGSRLQLRIADVTPTADAEIYEYTVEYMNGSSWKNLCGESNGVPVRALALAGRWDESSGTATGGDHIDDPEVFTFACQNAVLAKCVDQGYAPWRSLTECNGTDCKTIAMRDMHQACTRMMRADYCGDGTPHTKNGTGINVWDNFDIQTRDTVVPVTWTDEAEWSPNGAACIQDVRWTGTAETYIDQHCSNRWSTPAMDCFGQSSTFYTQPGFATPIATRSLFRNQFTHDAF